MTLKKALRYIGWTNKNKKRRRKKSSDRVLWEKADDIHYKTIKLLKYSKLPFNIDQITTLRSYDSKARAYARIWGLSKVWQLALKQKPHYIIEVLSEKFDKLPDDKKDEVLLHELAHIPNNFSGSLLPHVRHGKRSFSSKVDKLIKSVRQNSKNNDIS